VNTPAYLFLAAALASPSAPWADPLTQAQRDSGWVSLFDGRTLNGFYSINRGEAPRRDLEAHPDGIFSVRASEGIIRSEGLTTAHLVTVKSYSHYRVRVRVKYDKPGDTWLNSGILYHTRIEASRLYGTYPRSIEFQGQKRGMGEAWTIGKVFVNTTVDPSQSQHKYLAGGKPVAHGGEDPNRQCLGGSNPFVDGEWNAMEALVRGADSVAHIVNGVTVFRATRLRWSDANDPDDFSHMLSEGSLAFQVEGDAPNYVAPISYKDFAIMELDAVSGLPINGKTVRLMAPAASPGLKAGVAMGPAGFRGLDGRYLDAINGKSPLRGFGPAPSMPIPVSQ
jgi:hypothetical protein